MENKIKLIDILIFASISYTYASDIREMLETPHVVVGAAIATKIPNPALAIPLALGSHFILELVPHWNPHLNTELRKHGRVTPQSTVFVTLESSLALVMGSFLASQALPDLNHAFTIAFACFVAVLPDVVEAPYFFLDFRPKILKRWVYWQKSIQADAKPFLGTITQLITIAGALWWIFS